MTTTGTVLKDVLSELDIPYELVDEDRVVFALQTQAGKPHFIINNILGINSESDVKLCADKAYTHDILSDVVRMPKTKKYLDPEGPYSAYAQFSSLEAIYDNISSEFELPCVVKKNSGSLGSHVFWCEDAEAVRTAGASIFNKQSRGYDHVLLAQEGIAIKEEWRVVVLHGRIQFMYQKDTVGATFSGNLSPLHWEDSKAVLVSDALLSSEIQAFLDPIFAVWQLPYGGFDVVRDKNGMLWLLEINSHPAFSIFLRDNDAEPLKKVYRKVLREL